MAGFCGNCGSPLGAGGPFCPNCGTPAGTRPNPVAASPLTSPYPNSAAAAPKSSSALKIVIVLLCCLVLGGAAVVGGLIYAAHRVKQAVVQRAAENGVDLNSITNSFPNDPERRHSLPKVCELLSKEEVSQLIGQPIERVENQQASCVYYGPPGLSAKLAQENASSTFKRAQVPNANVSGTEVANSVDQMVNSLAAQAGQSGSGGELPLLMLGLDADGKAQMTALSVTKAIFGGIGRTDDARSSGFGAHISGLGDQAIRLPKLGLNVLQGNIMLRVTPGPISDADERSIAIARAILPKL